MKTFIEFLVAFIPIGMIIYMAICEDLFKLIRNIIIGLFMAFGLICFSRFYFDVSLSCSDEIKTLEISERHMIIRYEVNTPLEEGVFRLDGKVRIHDNMQDRTVATLKASDTIFYTKTSKFQLRFLLPKNLPYSKIMNAKYAVTYRSGLVEERKRYSLIYDSPDRGTSAFEVNEIFRRPVSNGNLTLTYLGKERDKIIKKVSS